MEEEWLLASWLFYDMDIKESLMMVASVLIASVFFPFVDYVLIDVLIVFHDVTHA